MQPKDVISGLDIGSHRISCAVGSVDAVGQLSILGVTEVRSEGVRNGIIVDKELASSAISTVMKKAEEQFGVKPKRLFVNVTGEHIRGLNSRGAISISMLESEITEEEVEKVTDLAKAIRIPEDQERLHVIPQQYAVDDRFGIKDPIGKSGDRLEIEVHIVTASMSVAADILDCVKEAGRDVSELVFSPIGASEVLLTPDERRNGTVLIDIGAGTVDVAVFFEDALWHTSSIPLGSRNVTSDIAYGLRLPVVAAEELKICQGCAMISGVDPKEKLILPDLGEFYQRRISRTVLAAIIEPRMEEILCMVRKQLLNSPVFDKLDGCIVLTGGGSCLQHLDKLAERVFDMTARLGKPHVYDEEITFASPYGVAVAVGLVKYGYIRTSAESEPPTFFKRVGRKFEQVVNAILNI